MHANQSIMDSGSRERNTDQINTIGPILDGKRLSRFTKPDGERPPKRKLNPLQKGIQDFIANQLPPPSSSDDGLSLETLLTALPKRFTIYQPLLLLPANVFSVPPAWGALYASLDTQQREALYASISKSFSRMGVTHLAMNAPISLTRAHGKENRMRSPAGLVPLYGNFGPPPVSDDEEDNANPTPSDLDKAFWVRTVQNNGIVQIWSPLYTMFSRGNITEKARILGLGGEAAPFEGLDAEHLDGERIQEISVVDMYAGIGYFVFSYLKRGVKRVWGFEINGWSVEGLRRGCAANGWGCRVVRIRDDGALDPPIRDLVGSLENTDRVVIFHGDNSFAADILNEVKRVMDARKAWNSIRHVNLGLLPSSRPAWESACKMVDPQRGGWLHVHENVDVKEIDKKREEFTTELRKLWTQAINGSSSTPGAVAECRHVERVKTYAPGVMHCVFDIALSCHGSG